MPIWNEGHLTDQKPPLKPHVVWSIRTRLQMSGVVRELTLSNLDSELRGCGVAAIEVGDIARSGTVQFEMTRQTRGVEDQAGIHTFRKSSLADGSAVPSNVGRETGR